MNSTERLVVKAFFFAFEKSMVKVFFISLLAMFSFYEKHSKSYFSFLCSQCFAFTKSIVKVIFHFFARNVLLLRKA